MCKVCMCVVMLVRINTIMYIHNFTCNVMYMLTYMYIILYIHACTQDPEVPEVPDSKTLLAEIHTLKMKLEEAKLDRTMADYELRKERKLRTEKSAELLTKVLHICVCVCVCVCVLHDIVCILQNIRNIYVFEVIGTGM